MTGTTIFCVSVVEFLEKFGTNMCNDLNETLLTVPDGGIIKRFFILLGSSDKKYKIG